MGAVTDAGLVIIPGMELQTKEDIHVVCLFNSIGKAYAFQDYVYKHLPNIKNREDIFGEQLLFDKYDNIIGHNDKMLLSSADISFDEAFEEVRKLGGLFIPAHVDRDSFSVLYSLGFIPDYLDISLLEYNSEENIKQLVKNKTIINKYKYIKSSDAHYLYQILEKYEAIEINSAYSEKNADNILKQLVIP
jgi:PHP family Zn ribbon phosphoesterase